MFAVHFTFSFSRLTLQIAKRTSDHLLFHTLVSRLFFPLIFSIGILEISINTTNFELKQKNKKITRLLFYEGINYSSHEAL